VLWVIAKNIVLVFAILIALMQINIAQDLVQILFIWVVSTISLWLWLALWLWWADFVRRRLEKFDK
jgi:threonine/homoserine/homoserine lactone efflux protein